MKNNNNSNSQQQQQHQQQEIVAAAAAKNNDKEQQQKPKKNKYGMPTSLKMPKMSSSGKSKEDEQQIVTPYCDANGNQQTIVEERKRANQTSLIIYYKWTIVLQYVEVNKGTVYNITYWIIKWISIKVIEMES